MTSSTPALVIVNPRSGGGHAGRTMVQIRSVLERRLGLLDWAVTERSGHAIELARSAAAQGRGLIIAIGGDGTLHEVANGVLDAGGHCAVGYVGAGTGGDFRRTLGVDHRLDRYVEAIASGRERRIDVGRVRYRAHDGELRVCWFVNILSLGMGGLVDAYVSETTKVLGGRAAYFWASAKALARCQRARLDCHVSLAGEPRTKSVETYMMAICNGRYFGSGMNVAPMADPGDGRFEVVSLDAPSKIAFAIASRGIYGGKHVSAPGFLHFGCDRISIDLENDAARGVFLLDVDGEPLGGLPVDVELVPQALTLRI